MICAKNVRRPGSLSPSDFLLFVYLASSRGSVRGPSPEQTSATLAHGCWSGTSNSCISMQTFKEPIDLFASILHHIQQHRLHRSIITALNTVNTPAFSSFCSYLQIKFLTKLYNLVAINSILILIIHFAVAL